MNAGIVAKHMLPLKRRIREADNLLAPYAVPHAGILGREYPEPEDPIRFPLQRDRNRIIQSQAFRRLKHKTQVFVSGHGDHYRTRITHTLEVAEVSRDIARALGVNEDLAQAIALAHDLGHTPFGHAGEEAMNECMQAFGKTFEHNEQSLRVVTILEDLTTSFPGLNLSIDILDGLRKHASSQSRGERSPSLESQIVNCADEIAYIAHDTDDGLRAKQFTRADVRRTVLGKKAAAHAEAQGTELRRSLVDLLMNDLFAETEKRLKRRRIRTLDDVYASTEQLVGYSSAMREDIDELRAFLWRTFYASVFVLGQAVQGKKVIKSLFLAYTKDPPEKVRSLQKKTQGTPEEAVKDFIAGMTDTYALEICERL